MLFPEPPDLSGGVKAGVLHVASLSFLFYLGAVSESDMSGYSDMGETDTG